MLACPIRMEASSLLPLTAAISLIRSVLFSRRSLAILSSTFWPWLISRPIRMIELCIHRKFFLSRYYGTHFETVAGLSCPGRCCGQIRRSMLLPLSMVLWWRSL